MASLTVHADHQVLPWTLIHPETFEPQSSGTLLAGEPTELDLDGQTLWLELRDGTQTHQQVLRPNDTVELDLRDRPELDLSALMSDRPSKLPKSSWRRLVKVAAASPELELEPGRLADAQVHKALGSRFSGLHYRYWQCVRGRWRTSEYPEFCNFSQVASPTLGARCCGVPSASARAELELNGVLRVSTQNPAMDHLLELGALGANREAGLLAKGIAIDLFHEKFRDPTGAIVGAMHLLRAGHLRGREHWWENLGTYLGISDATAIYGHWLLRTGQSREPIDQVFLRAAYEGLPVLQTSLRLLYDGLGLFSTTETQQARERVAQALDAQLGDGPWVQFLGDPTQPGVEVKPQLSGDHWRPVTNSPEPLGSHIIIGGD